MLKQVMFAESDDEVLEINLKDPWLAAFLAWLVPGLGHIYQGRTGKGLLFLICIVGTFLYGLYIGDGRVVYAASSNVFSRAFFSRWQYICQLGVGLPALPAYIQARRADSHKPPLLADLMRPPVMKPGYTSTDDSNHEVMHPDELAKWHHDLSDRFEIGTVFTVIAGLLNVLVIFDAYGGPLVIPAQPDKKRADEEQKSG